MNHAIILAIAIACHEANKAWCEVNGDTSQKHWPDAENWQRESAMKGVEFRLNNPGAGQDAQHNAWMKDKIENGWVYGEIKDPIVKTHPCIVPFEKLPEFQQKKDALFCAIVDALKDKPTLAGPLMGTPLTFGERLVGKTFNPSGDEKVARAKAIFAEAADMVTQVPNPDELSFLVIETAMQQLLLAQMAVVKALTLKI